MSGIFSLFCRGQVLSRPSMKLSEEWFRLLMLSDRRTFRRELMCDIVRCIEENQPGAYSVNTGSEESESYAEADPGVSKSLRLYSSTTERHDAYCRTELKLICIGKTTV